MKTLFVLGIIALAAWALVFAARVFALIRMRLRWRKFEKELVFSGNVGGYRRTESSYNKSLLVLDAQLKRSQKKYPIEHYYLQSNGLLEKMLSTANELHDRRENMSCEELGSENGQRFAMQYENFLNAVDLMGDVREYLRRATEKEEREYEAPRIELDMISEGGLA